MSSFNNGRLAAKRELYVHVLASVVSNSVHALELHEVMHCLTLVNPREGLEKIEKVDEGHITTGDGPSHGHDVSL